MSLNKKIQQGQLKKEGLYLDDEGQQIRDFKFSTPNRSKINIWKGNFFLEDSSYGQLSQSSVNREP